MEIDELCDANIYDLMPEFVKAPLPAITLLGGSASFCTRITPVDSDVVWSICGREISEDMKEYKVYVGIIFHLYSRCVAAAVAAGHESQSIKLPRQK